MLITKNNIIEIHVSIPLKLFAKKIFTNILLGLSKNDSVHSDIVLNNKDVKIVISIELIVVFLLLIH